MKRTSLTVLMIGLVAAAIAAVLHAIGLFRPIEHGLSSVLSGQVTSSTASEVLAYLTACVLGIAVAWLTVNSVLRMRIGLLVAALAIELLIAAWIIGLYGRNFQPLPAIVAIGL